MKSSFGSIPEDTWGVEEGGKEQKKKKKKKPQQYRDRHRH